MSVIYRLESQRHDGDPWEPVIDEERQPLTFTGPSGKARAKNMAEIVCRWPSFVALRVMKSGEDEPVWTWTKQEDVSA